MRCIFGLICAVLPLALACSGSRSAAEPCTNGATATAIVEHNRSTDSADWLPRDDETTCRLRRALVTKEDLGNGWDDDYLGLASDTAFGGPFSGALVIVGCGIGLDERIAGRGVGFWHDGQGVDDSELHFVGQQIILLRPGAASRIIAALRHSCAAPEDDASTLVRSVARVELGDGGVSFEEDPLGEGLFERKVWLSHGDYLIGTETFGALAPDAVELARMAVDRLPEVGPLPEATSAGGDGCDAEPTPTQGPNAAAFADALLRIEDLPPRWFEYVPDPCVLPLGGECVAESVDLPAPLETAHVSFARADWRLAHTIRRFGDEESETLAGRIALRGKLPRECELELDGQPVTLQFTPLASPFGEDVTFWRVESRGTPSDPSSNELLLHVAVIRAGNLFAELDFGRFAPIPFGDAADELAIEQLSPAVSAARQKLQALAQEIEE